MAHASGSKSQITFINEVTWGTTPATPTMQAIPFKTWSMKPAVDSFSSAQMAPDRQYRGLTLGVPSASAELTAEFVPEVFDLFMESVCCAAWNTNVLKLGTVDKFFTIEEAHADISKFHTGKGMIATKMGLSVKEGFTEISFSFLGKSFSSAATTGANSVTAVPSHDPAATVNAVLSEGGSTIATITALEFTLENAVELGKPCNATSASGYAIGMAKLTGKLSAYFTDDTLLAKFLAGTATSITVQIGVAAGGIYEFDMSNVKYSGFDKPVDKEGLLAVALDFQALYDGTDASTLKITRTPHA